MSKTDHIVYDEETDDAKPNFEAFAKRMGGTVFVAKGDLAPGNLPSSMPKQSKFKHKRSR